MLPPIFRVCIAEPAVVAALGLLPTRLWPFGDAPHKPATPYAVWQLIGGAPENTLAHRPDIDGLALQIDVYGASGSQATAAATALRDAIEPHAHIVRWGGATTDPETGLKRITFDVDWYVER